MKTQELIDLIKKADPTGELPVCIDNNDIRFVVKSEAYWDGRLEQIIRDGNGCVIGAKVTDKGMKIQIQTLSIEDAIENNPDLLIEYDLENESDINRYKRQHEVWREDVKKILLEIEEKHKKNNG